MRKIGKYKFHIFDRFQVVLLLATVLFSFTACATAAWHDKINQDLKADPAKFTDSSVGFYLGTNDIDGAIYHHYIFSNVFKESKREFIEIYVPISNIPKTAIVRFTDQSSFSTSRAYMSIRVRYPGGSIYGSHFPINPKMVANLALYKEAFGGHSFSVDFPSLVILTIGSLGEDINVRLGRRMSSPNIVKIDNNISDESSHGYIYVCPDTPSNGDYYLYNHESRILSDVKPNCDMWRWSDIIASDMRYEPGTKRIYEVERYLGYLITVPLDVVTSPVQLPFWIMLYRFEHSSLHPL